MIFARYQDRPLLTRDDIPPMPPDLVDPSSVFNPGATFRNGVTHLLMRVQSRGRRTYSVPAYSEDGYRFTVAERPSRFLGQDDLRDPLDGFLLKAHHIYDPRITVCEDRILVVTAADTDRGCRLIIWEAAGDLAQGFGGLETLKLVAVAPQTDTRNGVLFPQKIGGRFVLLDRPQNRLWEGGPASGDAIALSTSDDLASWESEGQVFSGRPHLWDELVGAGPPPILTDQGWLLLYHGIATHFRAVNIYQVGAVLLDRDNPSRVIARTRDNILEPRRQWEMTGQVPNVVFPSGMVVTESDASGQALPTSRILVYYGAADTVVGLAEARLADVLAACTG